MRELRRQASGGEEAAALTLSRTTPSGEAPLDSSFRAFHVWAARSVIASVFAFASGGGENPEQTADEVVTVFEGDGEGELDPNQVPLDLGRVSKVPSSARRAGPAASGACDRKAPERPN
ncbi:hypothetical protein ACIRSD_46520, partial [Streptomyces acidicola]